VAPPPAIAPRGPVAAPRPVEPTTPPTTPTDDPVESPAIAPPTAGAARRATASSTLAETATALFASANDARRGADARTAIALFRKLQRLYPDSPEARSSRVALGGLLLDDGRAGAALDQFDRAVAADDGTLRPEALYGRARALGALHRDDTEALAWKQLLREFPTCPYADTARRRLAALAP
jgi:TolA-binding protein